MSSKAGKSFRPYNKEAKMLGDFIKLVDYMLVEGTVKRAVTTTEELLSLLEAPKKKDGPTSKGVFITVLAFTDTAWRPCCTYPPFTAYLVHLKMGISFSSFS